MNHKSLLPLGAMAAGFGLLGTNAWAQTSAPAETTPPAVTTRETVLPAVTARETMLPAVSARGVAEKDKNSLRATTSTIGKGTQELRDIPQSLTVVTERLIQDRQLDTLKAALHNTAGVTFLAAEGGEEDIRLRGFSLATTGDIFVDGIRDPAFYDRDTFANERIELLRGSASMLFGRGSTGGVVNQVTKQPNLLPSNEVNFTIGSGDYLRLVGDFNRPTDRDAALRVQTMLTRGDNAGLQTQKAGVAATYRSGIGTRNEWTASLYHLDNDNGINYGLPWLQGGLMPVSPRAYYGAASDYNRGTASHLTLANLHRFADGGELKTTLRQGWYSRDQRASTIRFFTNANPANGPVVVAPTRETFGPSTPLNRGAPNKVQNLGTTYAQADYSNNVAWLGLKHQLLAGVDAAAERFQNFGTSLPTGVVLNKNDPRPTVGNPNDGTSVDETKRLLSVQRAFEAQGLGAYVQDLVQIAPAWKLLGGLRFDKFSGDFRTPATATVAEVKRSRSDSLWSRRAGVLFQPSERMSLHFSYGTSFNTSGDTYQYDNQTENTPPESSQNFEAGGTFESADGNATLRVAVFRSTKLNERNRDPDNAAVQNLLSGKRHSAGIEVDLSGRLTPTWEVFGSYAWVPVARIDIGAPGVPAGTAEGTGTRPSLTPVHSGTLWSTYQVTRNWRVGAGLNMRGSQTPNRNPVGVRAPSFVTGDLLAEYSLEQMAFKLNLTNLSDRLYADSLYTGHYVPGAGRTLSFTIATRF